MIKYTIDKSFDFCYGHRVFNQTLNPEYTHNNDTCLACRHLHGHQGKIKIFLTTDFNHDSGEISNVEKTGMVTDFKHLGWFKNFIDDNLDHKFILALQDPLFKEEASLISTEEMKIKKDEGFWVPNMVAIGNYCDQIVKKGLGTKEEAQAIFEKYEGMIFVDFVPTSENLTAWFLRIAQEKMKDLPGVKVVAVEYWETPKSHCRVEAQD